ncbi:hypothetical protein SESBI_33302 [Sesbania bispinosa]|nr:hypothetical protein SESBI_33302 [Sesbania bispinosa]
MNIPAVVLLVLWLLERLASGDAPAKTLNKGNEYEFKQSLSMAKRGYVGSSEWRGFYEILFLFLQVTHGEVIDNTPRTGGRVAQPIRRLEGQSNKKSERPVGQEPGRSAGQEVGRPSAQEA